MSAVLVPPALEVIRRQTRAAHRDLELVLEIARPEADADAYLRYLKAVLGWLDPLEAQLWSSPWPRCVAAETRRGKTLWIEQDLRLRGLSEREIAAIPRRETLPPLASPAQRFGVAYVVEGAQLGGQVLLRRLGPRLAPLPARWLEGYGCDTGQRWRSFVAALGACLTERAQVEIAAQSACATFEWVHEWCAERGVA